jgi:predicted acetyltransferase
MKVELVEADDDVVLGRLAQLYQHDFSEFVSEQVSDDGLFTFIPIEDYRSESYDRYVIKVEGALAGFAIVSYGDSFRDPSEKVWWIDEFFVMRGHRKSGVGESAARRLFDSRDGAWEVGQIPQNTGAQAFWRRVIGRYTDGAFEEFEMNSKDWTGPVQYFKNP